MKLKYLILGAGPAGLSFANKLMQEGETDFLVLEQESEAGGLCRSVEMDGAPLDIGGGHFLDVRRKEVDKFLFDFMPESEWNLFTRDSCIEAGGVRIGHPYEANIWQLPTEQQVEYLKSIAVAGCNLGIPMPEHFVDWIIWKLGEKIAEDYMLPYNRKMFGEDLNQLGTYWLDKLPNVSFEETLLSCLNRKPYGKQPGHAQFYYPKKVGYGELWKRMGNALGSKIQYNSKVSSIDFDRTEVTLETNEVYEASFIITTIPWTAFRSVQMPLELQEEVTKLKHTSVVITYYPELLPTEAHWIYEPDPALDYHRILVRHNFIEGARGYWTETNLQRFHLDGNYSYQNEYAYPLNTLQKPAAIKKLLAWAREKHVIGLGRWGEWEHYNSDVVVERALSLAQEFCDTVSG